MLAYLIYFAACFGISMVLTFIFVMFKSVQSRDEMKSWRVLGFLFVFVTAAPYVYAEVMTRMVGQEMKDAVTEAVADAGVDGELQYFKVIFQKGGTTRVIAVALEQADWGGTERPVLAMTLKKDDKQKWTAESYRVVNSDSRNQDGWTFPPYF